jgi:hypothetical protein
MKPTNRIRLTVIKKLPCGVIDRFTTVVMAGKKDAVKKQWESQGYRVIG